MSADKYTGYAEQALAERGQLHPSNELVRLEMVHQHLEEACCLASLLEQPELERAIASVIVKVRDQRGVVETCSVIV